MNILIIGNGAREHALAWKVAQSPQVEKIWVAKGNPGTAREPKTQNLPIEPTDIDALLEFAKTQHIDLTIVGPETPLACGITDLFQAHDLNCFGPTKIAAQLESSKIFAKQFMQKHGIPSAAFETFTESIKAKEYLKTKNFPVVIKADGLAAGKGVFIIKNILEGEKIVDELLEEQRFGIAGQKIIIEDFIVGEELSYIVLVDGEHVLPLASSQDHKRRDSGDEGPNTGGMGAYSPSPLLTPDLETNIMNDVLKPVLLGLKKENIHYSGFLYVGLMITQDLTPQVLEFNCRLGDPEAQVILMRMQSDLPALCLNTLAGKLNECNIQWHPQHAITVVMAAQGYPEKQRQNDEIFGLEKVQHVKVFHGGTTEKNGVIHTQGGRVLCVTAMGNTLKNAQKLVYQEIKKIHWTGCFYRTDIGQKGIKHAERSV